jgi:hypothetical protein
MITNPGLFYPSCVLFGILTVVLSVLIIGVKSQAKIDNQHWYENG